MDFQLLKELNSSNIYDLVIYGSLLVVILAMIYVGSQLGRNKYRQAFRVYAQRSYLEGKSMSNADIQFATALQAEETIRTILKEEGWENIFLRRRVAVARVGHNREIDVLAVGPVVLVVEVKHWQGYVWCNGPRWYQRANAKKGTLEFEDVQEDNVEKAAAVRRYLENTRRIQLPDRDAAGDTVQPADGATSWQGEKGTWYTARTLHKQIGKCVLPVVVFTNPKVKLDPASIKKKHLVFDLHGFRVFVRELLKGNIPINPSRAEAISDAASKHSGQSSFLPRMISTMSSALHLDTSAAVQNEKLEVILDDGTKEKVSLALDVLRTWDIVYLHDGQMITGDVIKINAPNAFCMYERQYLLDIKITWNKGVGGLLKTLLTNKAGSVEVVLTSAKRLAVKKKEKKERNSQGNVVFDIEPKRLKRSLTDRIEIKVPGTNKIMTYAITDIKDIQLSHHLFDLEKDIV